MHSMLFEKKVAYSWPPRTYPCKGNAALLCKKKSIVIATPNIPLQGERSPDGDVLVIAGGMHWQSQASSGRGDPLWSVHDSSRYAANCTAHLSDLTIQVLITENLCLCNKPKARICFFKEIMFLWDFVSYGIRAGFYRHIERDFLGHSNVPMSVLFIVTVPVETGRYSLCQECTDSVLTQTIGSS